MEKNYDHNKYEKQIYDLWETGAGFAPSGAAEYFSIIMPPPNANDPLHVGHAMFLAVEDILVRYNRMKGRATMWLPGTDHAGIETQFVFEKKLAKQGKSRFNFDRQTLFAMIWDYVQENSGVAVEQMKKIGASADWSRFKFTLDPKIVKLVVETFAQLHRDGLVYRGERLVNYCCKCGTGYSELEVEYVERNDPMYYMKYGPFTIATARPETKFRDTALAVNPNDPRYKEYLGKEMEITGLLGKVKMKIVPDEEVDPEFGTGIMKVTPAHDPHDFELGEKFGLPVTPIIGTDGKMDFSWFLEAEDFDDRDDKYKTRAKMYHKVKAAEVRKLMVEHLKEDGLLEKIDENYVHRVGTCYRCGSVLEPLPMPQFFVKTKPLAEKALTALDNGETVVLGAGREKILRHWLENIRDWNISRQIVWGIRIPVWYEADKNLSAQINFINKNGELSYGQLGELLERYPMEEIEVGLQKITVDKAAEFVVAETKPSPRHIQETDTFDTWFSSGQWPVVTLKTGEPGDWERFYPTSVMETGYDILPIWVMRMMMLGIYVAGKSPFKRVYLHGLIRDEKGQKMSKSKGNVINPVEMIDKYGADALRMALVISSTPGQDKGVGETAIKGMRNLSNKIWNAFRYVNGVEDNSEKGEKDDEVKNKLAEVATEIGECLENLRPGLAAETAHNSFWHWFCDEVIELHKQGKVSTNVLREGMGVFLKILHPFMPFVTETLWQTEKGVMTEEKMLMRSSWPEA